MTYKTAAHKTHRHINVDMLDYIAHAPIKAIKAHIRWYPEHAQDALLAEYKRHPRPRYSLTQWLKRHRPNNPTTRVIRTGK